jgi:large subunit ribosomal protein L13
MKTFSPRPRDIERHWYVVDADGAVLGRLASHVATILRGKHKPIYAPHADTGDHVIVVNAKGIRLSGGKEREKVYYRHSGYPGGLRQIGYETLLSSRPALAVEKAIVGMLPKTRLGRQMLKKLSVYEGAEHPHQAQKPVALGPGEFPRWEGLPKPKPKPAPSSDEAKPAARKDAAGPRSRAKRATAPPTGPARGRAAGSKRARAGGPKAATRAGQAKPTPAGKASSKGSSAQSGATDETSAGAVSSRSSSAKRSSSRTPEAGTKTEKAAPKEDKPKRTPRRAKKES